MQITDSTFERCDLRDATIRDCKLTRTTLISTDLHRNSITSNLFARCSFADIDFGDCTALFLFFDYCQFERCRFSTECVGYTYGLTIEDLENSNFTYLGETQAKPSDTDLVPALVTNYVERGWFVGACALALNFRLLVPAVALRDLVSRLNSVVALNRDVDWDELQFLALILQRLQTEGRLPLVGIWPLFRFINDAFHGLERPSHLANVGPAPELVLTRLQALVDIALDEIESTTIRDIDLDRLVTAKLLFQSRPRVPLNELVPERLFRIYGILPAELQLLSARPGSWLEIWQATVGVLATVQTSLVAINGMLGQLIRLGRNTRTLSEVLTGRPSTKGSTRTRRPKRSVTAQRAKEQRLISLVDQKSALARRVPKMPDEELRRLDQAMVVMLALPNEALAAFSEYSAEVLVSVQVTPRRRKTKRRARQSR